MIETCPVCEAGTVEPVWGMAHAQIFQLLRAGEPPRPEHFAAVELVRCRRCAHLYNQAYEASLADRMYGGELLSNVPVHVSMSRGLEQIAEWIGQDLIAGKRVIEIGGGSGHLARLLARTAKRVWVFEPSRGLRAESLPEANIALRNEPYAAGRVEEPVELIVCRQVLEHVADPLAMLREIRSALSADGCCYLEVPSAEYIEEHAALFDLHGFHVQYFHEPNLLRLAARAGFGLVRSWQLKQAHDVGVLLRPQPAAAITDWSTGALTAATLRARLSERREQLRAWLTSLEGAVSLYGATAQGGSFLHAFQADRRFAAAADDNPDYAGYALYSRTQTVPVVSPSHAVIRRSDHVILTAYLHDAVLTERLRSSGFDGGIFSMRDPAPAPLLARSSRP